MLADIWNLAGHGPEQFALADLCLGREVRVDKLQRVFPTSKIPWFCKISAHELRK